jgi:hypothetical protein
VNVFILRAGAYVGEVIRRSSSTSAPWHWLDYQQAAALRPTVASLGMSIGTAAVLFDGQRFIFPLAKVNKYLENGSEDSVHFYAQVVLGGPASAS